MNIQAYKMGDNIKVVVKVRPLIKRELDEKATVHWRVDNKCLYQIDHHGRKIGNSYTFDRVYDENSKTSEVYEEIAKPIVDAATVGINGTIFAYGQTSSGKTYTMMGDKDYLGIIQHAIYDIFDKISKMADRDFLLRVSYIEIYNETIQDLLSDRKTNLKVSETPDGVKVVAEERNPSSPEEVLAIMKQGEENRKIGATNLNEQSSRSHTIFQIVIESKHHDEDDGCVNVSQLNLVDLAGSERSGQTGATGQRFKEGTHINKSLSALGLVIKQLSEDPNKFINYRDSKLTRILCNSLGGNAKTSIICAITPAAIEETISTLQFATRAKNIKNKPEVNAVATEATMLPALTKKLAQLQFELENKKYVEMENKKLSESIKELQNKILNSLTPAVGSNKPSNRRKTWCATRRATISTLQTIDEFSIPENMPTRVKFSTPLPSFKLSHKEPQRTLLDEQSLIEEVDESIIIDDIPASPKPKKNVQYIEIDDSDEDMEVEKDNSCSPYHKCFTSKIPPCVLKKQLEKYQKENEEILEMTKLEKIYSPTTNELIEQLESVKDQVNNLKKEKDATEMEKNAEIESLKQRLIERENEVECMRENIISFKKEDYKSKCIELEIAMDNLKKKMNQREEELLMLLQEQNNKEKTLFGSHEDKPSNALKNFMDLSRDITLVHNDSDILKPEKLPLFEEEIETLRHEIEIKNKEIQLMEQKVLCAEQKAEALQKDCFERMNELEGVNEKYENLLKENLEITNNIKYLQRDMNLITEELKNAKEDVKSYKIIIDNKETKVLKDYKESEIQVEKKNDILEIEKKDVEELKSKLSVATCDLCEFNKTEICRLADECKMKLKTIHSLEVDLRESNKRNEILLDEIENLRAECITLEKLNCENKTEFENIKDQLALINLEYNSLKKEHSISNNFMNINKKLEQQLEEYKKDLQVTQQNANCLEGVAKDFEKRFNSLTEIIDSIKSIFELQDSLNIVQYPSVIKDLIDSQNRIINDSKLVIKKFNDIEQYKEFLESKGNINNISTNLERIYEFVVSFIKRESNELANDNLKIVNENLKAELAQHTIHIKELEMTFEKHDNVLNDTISQLENTCKNLNSKLEIVNREKQSVDVIIEKLKLDVHYVADSDPSLSEFARYLQSLYIERNEFAECYKNINNGFVKIFNSPCLIDYLYKNNLLELQNATEIDLNICVSKLQNDLLHLKNYITTTNEIHKNNIIELDNIKADMNKASDTIIEYKATIKKIQNEKELIVDELKYVKERLGTTEEELASTELNNVNIKKAHENCLLLAKAIEDILSMKSIMDFAPSLRSHITLLDKVVILKALIEQMILSADRNDLTVLHSKYDDLQRRYEQENAELSELKIKYANCLEEIDDIKKLVNDCQTVRYNNTKETTAEGSNEYRNVETEMKEINLEDLDITNEKNNIDALNIYLTNQLITAHKEIRSLIDLIQELNKKIIWHRKNLSILTATTYAENKLLASRAKSLEHHHDRLHKICERDLIEISEPLKELYNMLKEQFAFEQQSLFRKLSVNSTLLDETTSYARRRSSDASYCDVGINSTSKSFTSDMLMLENDYTLSPSKSVETVKANNSYNQTSILNQAESMVDIECQTDICLPEISSDSHKQQYLKIEAELNQKQGEVANLLRENSQLKNQKQLLQAECDTLSSDLMDNIEEMDRLKMKISSFEEQDKIIREDSHLSTALTEHFGRNTECLECKSKKNEIEKMKSEIYYLSQKDSLSNSGENFFSTITEQLDEVNAEGDQLMCCRSTIFSLQNELHASKEECKKITEQIAGSRNQMSKTEQLIWHNEIEKNKLNFEKTSDVNMNKSAHSADVQLNLVYSDYNLIVNSITEEKSKCIKYLTETVKVIDLDSLDSSNSFIDLLEKLYTNLYSKFSNEVENLNNKLVISENTISSLQNEVENLEKSFASANQKIVEKAKDIERVQTNYDAMVNSNNVLTSDLKRIEEEIISLSLEILNVDLLKERKSASPTELLNEFIKSLIEKHQTLISEYKDQCLKLNLEIKERDEEYLILKQEKKTLSECNEVLEANVIVFKDKISELEAQLKSLSEAKKLIEEDKNKLTENHTELNKLYEKVVTDHSRCAQDIASEISDKENTKLSLLNKYNEEIITNEKKSAELLQLQANYKVITDQHSECKTKIENSNYENVKLNERLKKQIEENDIKVKQAKILEENVFKATSILENYQTEKQAMICEYNQIKLENNHMKNENYELKHRLKETEQICPNISNEYSKQVKDVEQTYDLLKREFTFLKQVNISLAEEKDKLSSDLSKSEDLLSECRTKLEVTLKKIATLEEQIAELEKNCQIKDLDIRRLNEENAILKGKASDWQNEAGHELRRTKEKLESKLNEIIVLERNNKTHQKSAEQQAVMVKRLKRDKECLETLLNKKSAELEIKCKEIEKCEQMKTECEKLRLMVDDYETQINNMKLINDVLEERLCDTPECVSSKGTNSNRSSLNECRRRRQSFHDTQRNISDNGLNYHEHVENSESHKGSSCEELQTERILREDNNIPRNREKIFEKSCIIKHSLDRLLTPNTSDIKIKEQASSSVRLRRLSLHSSDRSIAVSDNMTDDDNEIRKLKAELSELRRQYEELEEKYREVDEECEICGQTLRERDKQCDKLIREKEILIAKVSELQSYAGQSAKKKRQSTYDLSRQMKPDTVDVATNTIQGVMIQGIDTLTYEKERERVRKLQTVVENLKSKNSELGTEIRRLQQASCDNTVVLMTPQPNLQTIQMLNAEIETLKKKTLALSTEKLQLELKLENTQQLFVSQPLATQQPFYVSAGSAIVQNAQISALAQENQKLKHINTKLMKMCKKLKKTDEGESKENNEGVQF